MTPEKNSVDRNLSEPKPKPKPKPEPEPKPKPLHVQLTRLALYQIINGKDIFSINHPFKDRI